MKIKQESRRLRNRMIAACVGCIMAVGIMPAGILAQGGADVWTVDFGAEQGWSSNEGFAQGAVQNGWTFQPSPGNSVIKILDQGNGDQCLNFLTYPDTHTQWPEAKYLFAPTSKRVTEVSFDTYFKTDHPQGYTMQVLFNDAEEETADYFVDMMSVSAIPGYSVYEQLDGQNRKIMPTLPYDTYVPFRVRFDNDCDGAGTKRIGLYLGDTCVYEANIDGPKERDGIKGIRFTTKSDAYDADFRIDNIKIAQTDQNMPPYACGFEQQEGWSVNDGFDSGAVLGNWKFKTTAGNNLIKIADQGQGDQCLNFITYPDTHTQWPAARTLFPSTTKRVTDVRFKTSFREGHSKGYTMQLLFNDIADYEDTVDNKFVDIMSIAAIEGYSVYEKLDGKNTKIVKTLPYDTACEFLVRFDNDSDGNGTKRIYLYKDGVFLFATKLDGEAYAQRTGVKGIRFTTTSDAYDADFTIDDIGVTQSSIFLDSSRADFNSAGGWTQNEGFANGAEQGGWTFSTAPGNNVIKVLNQGGEDNCLNFITYPDTPTKWPIAQYAVAQTSKRFTSFAFKTYLAQDHNAPYKVGAMFDDTETAWTDLLEISPEGVKEQVTADKRVVIPSVPYGEYCTFDMIYDNQENENGEKKLYIFCDKILADTIPLPSDSFSNKTGIKGIRFNMDSTAYNADFRIDDVTIAQSEDAFFVEIEDEGGMPVQTPECGGVIATIKAVNLSSSELPLWAVFAGYYKSALLDVAAKTAAVEPGTIGELTVPVDCDGTQTLYKLYLWNGFETIHPYKAPAVIY